jgi:hypothetical protein
MLHTQTTVCALENSRTSTSSSAPSEERLAFVNWKCPTGLQQLEATRFAPASLNTCVLSAASADGAQRPTRIRNSGNAAGAS